MTLRTMSVHETLIAAQRVIPLVLVALLLAMLPVAAHSQGTGVKMSPVQKRALIGLMKFMKTAFNTPKPGAEKGILNETLKDCLGQPNGNHACYAKTKIRRDGGDVEVETTVCHAVDNLMELIKNDRVRFANLGAHTGAETYPVEGVDGDLILIDTNLWNRVFTNAGNAGSFRRSGWKMALLWLMTNELAHVYQKFDGSFKVQCDAERDSDVFSKKLLCRIANALEDNAGDPHTTAAAINADPQRIPGLSDLLGDCGDTSGVNIVKVHTMVKDHLKLLCDRITMTFNPPLAMGVVPNADSWGKAYYGRAPRRGVRFFTADAVRSKLTYTEENGTTHDYAPSNGVVTQHMAYLNDASQLVLVVSTWSLAGSELHFWVDTNGDLIPETTQFGSPISLSLGATPDPGLNGVFLSQNLPGQFTTTTSADGLLVHDLEVGSVMALELDAQGLPTVGPVFTLMSDSLLTEAGGFIYLNDIHQTAPNDFRFVFSVYPRMMQHRFTPAIGLEGQGATVGGWSLSAPLAAVPNDLAAFIIDESVVLKDSHGLVQGLPEVVGPAFDATTLRQIDFSNLVLDNEVLGATGEGSGALIFPTPPTNGVLFRIEGSSDHTEYFVPPIGYAADAIDNVDENGDGADDRIDLTQCPPRLHLSLGQAGPSSETRQHVYEMVLEEGDPLVIENWDAMQRSLGRLDGMDQDLLLLPGSNPPLYVQSLSDLDGDGGADEGVVVRRQHGQSDYILEIIDSVLTTPTPVVFLNLPQGFVPEHYIHLDFDLDSDIDLCFTSIHDESLILVNDGFGNFTLNLGSIYGGTGDLYEMIVTIDDELPRCGGIVDANDFSDLRIDLVSPDQQFIYSPVLIGGQFHATGTLPFHNAGLGLRIDLGGSPAPFLLFDGTAVGPLGQGLLLPAGNSYQFIVPPGLSGQSLMLQSMVITPLAANGFFATSAGTEVRFN